MQEIERGPLCQRVDELNRRKGVVCPQVYLNFRVICMCENKHCTVREKNSAFQGFDFEPQTAACASLETVCDQMKELANKIAEVMM